MPDNCCSIGAATALATSSAVAPGYTAVTCTTGGVMRGYRSMGSEWSEKIPSSTMAIEITAAKMGRRTKKYRISGSLVMGADPERGAGRRGQCRIAARRAARVGRRHVRDGTHGNTRHDFLNAVHDDAIAGAQAAADQPLAAHERVALHVARAHLVGRVHDVDERAAEALLHRALRDEDRAHALHAEQRHTHELSRQQRVLRVPERRAERERPRALLHGEVGEVELAHNGIDAAIGER